MNAGPENHDVTADPLTPYWRAKVEAAAAGQPMPREARPREALEPFPEGLDPDPRDAMFIKLWNVGAPYHAIAGNNILDSAGLRREPPAQCQRHRPVR